MTGDYPQYLFGDSMFVSPVINKLDTQTQMATKAVWIPPGQWIEKDTGLLLTGDSGQGSILTKAYDLSEIPVFVRAGAIVPEVSVEPGNTLGLASQPYNRLTLNIYPGLSTNEASFYQDDGVTMNYLQGDYAYIVCNYARTQTDIKVTILTDGSYPGMVKNLPYRLRIINSWLPTAVTVNGQPAPFSRNPKKLGLKNSWHYDGNEATLVIEIEPSTTATVSVSTDAPSNADALLSGLKGGLQHSILAKHNLDDAWATPGGQDTSHKYLMLAAGSADVLSYAAGQPDRSLWVSTVTNFKNIFSQAQDELNSMSGASKTASNYLSQVDPGRLAYSKALLANAYTTAS
jgi:alpha-glucosidase